MTVELGTVTVELGAVTVELGTVTVELGTVTVELGAVTVELGAVTVELGAVTVELGAVTVGITVGGILTFLFFAVLDPFKPIEPVTIFFLNAVFFFKVTTAFLPFFTLAEPLINAVGSPKGDVEVVTLLEGIVVEVEF